MIDTKIQLIQFLVNNLQESLDVEVKNWLNGFQENGDKAKLAKEIIALANSGGGLIFIGFEDQGDVILPEIKPAVGELEAFTQDAIAEIVQRYVSPPCQCRVEMVSRKGSENQHPVIIVPGEHRTPLFAAKGSRDGRSLASGKVYIRRPGGYSEEARTQDDWEKLIDRLVKARQGDMLDSIREILSPSSGILMKDEGLDSWRDENMKLWQQKINEFPEDDPRHLKNGFWTLTFSINPFQTENLTILDTALQQMPKFSGWPPFTYLYNKEDHPRPQDNCITAYFPSYPWDISHDFWHISRDGKGFMLRHMQEDDSDYINKNNVHPRPQGLFFDWTLPIYRMTEVLKFIEALAKCFSDENASFHLIVNYCGTQNRRLQQHYFTYNLTNGAVCRSDSLNSSIKEPVTKIETNIEELIFRLLAAIYEQFDFTGLPPMLVKNVMKEALNY
ncbi:MAG: ATP-binding protein [Cyanobacteria bacterium MAG CAR4_bin_6]|nr:ATP-binding protein [Cyanobacteria bacterium MAG CAR4_bin_6]